MLELSTIQHVWNGVHPARRMPFDELYNGLMAIASGPERLINAQFDETGRRVLFNYSHNCQFAREWNVFTMIARGLILDTVSRKVVATPFPKFFNLGEDNVYWHPSETFEVLEKMDGCLGVIYRWQPTSDWQNGPAQVATRGSMFSQQSQTASGMLKNYNSDAFLPGWTYLVEIIHPQHRIIVPYNEAKLVLLGAYDENGNEADREQLNRIAVESGLAQPKVYQVASADEAIALANTFGYDQEGFVIKYRNGYRVKVKGAAYLEKHKVAFNFGPLAVYESFLNDADPDVYKKLLPEELWSEFDVIFNSFKTRFQEKLNEVKEAYDRTQFMTDKELGLSNEPMKTWVFAARKRNLFVEVLVPGSRMRKSFTDDMRPAANQLDAVGASELEKLRQQRVALLSDS